MQLCIYLKKVEPFQHGGRTCYNAVMREQIVYQQSGEDPVEDANEYLVSCMEKHFNNNWQGTRTGVKEHWQNFVKEMEEEDYELTMVHYKGIAIFQMYDFRSEIYRPFTRKLNEALINYASSLGNY